MPNLLRRKRVQFLLLEEALFHRKTTMSTEGRDPASMTQFGVFYPRGYIVAAFASRQDAERVRRELLIGGYDEQDCELLASDQVEQMAKQSLSENNGFLARLGKSDEAVRRHLQAAEKGATFLLIYAPGDLDAERAMNVVRRVPFKFAHQYHRLAIEVLQ
jgi:hypothetical protein